MDKYFDGLIGQENLKRKLSFYLDAFKETSRLPFILFCGAKGFGKTAFARAVGKNLKNKDGSKRPFYEVNSSILQNNRTFFESIFMSLLHDKEATVLFDESHNIPKDLSQALLTICNTDKGDIRQFQWQDSLFEFDFTRLTFMFATTEQDRLFAPLKDRLDIVDFESYTQEDTKKLVKMYADSTVFQEDILDKVVQCTRGNARSCVKMAENITTFCRKCNRAIFGEKEWKELCYALNILPYGLTSSEITLLRELQNRGACSLNMLASATGLSRSAIQRDVEQYLLYKNFMKIDGKRMITEAGQKVLKMV